MCDQDAFDDMTEYHLKSGVSRREFGALTLGASLISLLPRGAAAAEVTETEVQIKTADGTCDAYFVHPAQGAHPGVLSGRISSDCARRFARWASASPNRLRGAGSESLPRQAGTDRAGTPDFNDPATRTALMSLMGALRETTFTDAKAFIPWLDAQSAVDKRKMGTTGYCMGRPLTCERRRDVGSCRRRRILPTEGGS